MSQTLQKRIIALVRQTFDRAPGAWLVWCDPRGEWTRLLERVAADERLGGFPLLRITARTAGAVGGLLDRQAVQTRLAAGESFVLVVPAAPHELGWLWAHALLAEHIYTQSLREQLLAWGWRPPTTSISDSEIAALAWQGFQQDPHEWSGGGLQPDLTRLLEVVAGAEWPRQEDGFILERTIEQVGLPALDARLMIPQDSQPPSDPQSLRELTLWRTQSLARLLVTQAQHVAPRLVSDRHELLMAAGQRPIALDLLNRWLDSLRLRRNLATAIIEADKIAVLGEMVREASLKVEPLLSCAGEQAIFAATCTRLAQKRGKELLQALASSTEDFERHAHGFWGDGCIHPQAIPWGELRRLSEAAELLLEAAPTTDWTSPSEAMTWYTAGGWRLDHAGEAVLRNLSRATPELLALITPLREAYRARWEKTLIQWSDLWTKAGCPQSPLDTAGTWLGRHLTAPRPTAILVVDALRYDLGAALAAQINQHEGTELRASLQAARAPLPSITALGMGFAMPIPESQLQASYGEGGWRLIDATTGANLSLAQARRTWWQQHGVPAEHMLSLSMVLQGSVPTPRAGGTRLLITDDTIDVLGHDDELEFSGASRVIDRYHAAIRRLREHEWRRILIVTDHGFILWAGTDDRAVPAPLPGAAYKSRRALAYAPDVAVSTPHTTAPGGAWKVVPARGAASWSAYGGLGYFHGGASLQEWIIPCVQVEWPLDARPVQVTIQPVAYVLSQRPRLTLVVERGSLFVEDALPRRVDVVIRLAATRTILFRPVEPEIELNPAQEQISITLQAEKNVTADWDAPLEIEVRDRQTEEVIAQTASLLRVDLDEW